MIEGFYTCIDRKMNTLLYRGYDADGQKVYNTYKFRPVMYLESKDKNAKWKSLDGLPLEPLRFDSMSDCRAFVKSYEDVDGFKVYGNDRHIPAFIQAEFPNEISYNSKKIDVVSLDIECRSDNGFPEPSVADQEITAIGLKSSRLDYYIIWGLKEYDSSQSKVPHLKKEFRRFETEAELLHDFISWWFDTLNTPDVVTGWNIRLFDIPYLVNRLSRVLGTDAAKKMSPWNYVEQKSVVIKGKENFLYNLYGIQQLDYLDLFKKFAANTYGAQESYRLDFIAEVVLGQNKLDYSEYGTLTELYERDYQTFIDYNIVDIELIERLEAKLGLINLVFTLSYFGGVNYGDTLGTVAIWDSIIFRKLASRKIAIPPNTHSFKTDYAGGFVKEPQVGRHEWVMSFDLNSLYPNLIVQYNMSPETILPHSKVAALQSNGVDKILNSDQQWSPSENVAVAANGAAFKCDKQGILPEIIEELYNQRVAVKRKMLDFESEAELLDKGSRRYKELQIEIDRSSNKQMCLKILLNSLYGAAANKYFRYFNIDIAEGITLSGQLAIHTAEKAVNEYLSKALKDKTPKDRITASDTDSIYINLCDVIDTCKPKDPHEFLIKFGKEALEPVIKSAYESLAQKTGVYKNTMVMKVEKISSVAIFTAKKRYILNVLSSEGVRYAEPKIVMKGIEAIKSSTPKICRDEFKKIFKILVTERERDIQAEVAKFRDVFDAYDVEKMAFPRGVTDIAKWSQRVGAGDNKVPYKKGTPMNSRAAIMYNHLLKQQGLTQKYHLIKGGDKIKYTFLRKNNPTRENVIGFLDVLPPEFNLHQWVDRDHLFEKTFLEPLQLVLNAVHWKAIPVATLEDFFS
jgi:DNA polymerase elongation subunit (family B)